MRVFLAHCSNSSSALTRIIETTQEEPLPEVGLEDQASRGWRVDVREVRREVPVRAEEVAYA